MPIPRHSIGTLHAHCYRALGGPDIAELHIDDWNKTHPELALSAAVNRNALEEGAVDQTRGRVEQTRGRSGDEAFLLMEKMRARMTPLESWRQSALDFRHLWNEWKAANGLMDFTNLLETALRDIHIAPGDPSVLIADEAQDFSKLQLTLIRQWGRHAEYMLVAGDEDQLIYGWCGCTVDAFLQPPVPAERKRVLQQSFRVPRAVHAHATKWVEQLTVREPKEYLPRDADGEVRACTEGDWKNPVPILVDAEQYLADGKTVMFLATCAYMLDPLKKELRAAGIPFHNPYRRSRGDWNPLRRVRDPGSTAARILAFLRPRPDVWGDDAGEWKGEELRRWVELVASDGLLVRGARSAIASLAPDTPVDIETIASIFEPDAAEEMIKVLVEGKIGDCIEWLQAHMRAAKSTSAEYPAAVLLKHGTRALLERPRVILGTIHSVKGGQADVVYLFPDLSPSGATEWTARGERQDGIIRQIYVGMTRARESLIICRSKSHLYVPIGPRQ